MCQAPLQFTLIAIILKGPLLNPGMTSAQGNQHGQVLGAAGCWKAPQDSLIVNFYNHASWFYGSSAEQTTLKGRPFQCLLSGAIGGGAAGPYRDYEGDSAREVAF